jgi:hypothetical protein
MTLCILLETFSTILSCGHFDTLFNTQLCHPTYLFFKLDYQNLELFQLVRNFILKLFVSSLIVRDRRFNHL